MVHFASGQLCLSRKNVLDHLVIGKKQQARDIHLEELHRSYQKGESSLF